MEAARDLLRKALNYALVLSPDILIAEPREQVLLVQLVQLGGLLRNICQVLGDFFLHIDPARWKQVHLNHHVAIIVETAVGDQAPAFLRVRGGLEAIGGAEESWLFGGMVCKGLSVGYVAVCGRIRLGYCDGST